MATTVPSDYDFEFNFGQEVRKETQGGESPQKEGPSTKDTRLNVTKENEEYPTVPNEADKGREENGKYSTIPKEADEETEKSDSVTIDSGTNEIVSQEEITVEDINSMIDQSLEDLWSPSDKKEFEKWKQQVLQRKRKKKPKKKRRSKKRN